MKNNNFIILILVILFGSSCKEERDLDKDIDQYTITVSNSKPTNKSLLNYIDEYSYLELKTNKNNYIANISKVISFDNKYFVLDRKKSNLFVFDKKGIMLRKIGQRGNGPGEYNDIADFAINTDKKIISILSNKKIKILEYDLNGNFINDKSFNTLFPKKMNLINNNYYALYTDNSNDSFNDLAFSDLSGDIAKELFPYPKNIFEMSFDFTGGISKFGNRFLYSRSTSPIIHEIDDDLNVKTIFNIDLGAKSWNEENKFDLERFGAQLSKLEMSYLGNEFFINRNHLYFNYTEGRKRKRGFYNLSTKELYTTDSFKNNGLNLLFGSYVGIDDKGRNIVAYSPEYFEESSNYFKGLKEEIQKLDNELYTKFSNSDENSNQFLMFFNLNLE